jgi:hypothetical protein
MRTTLVLAIALAGLQLTPLAAQESRDATAADEGPASPPSPGARSAASAVEAPAARETAAPPASGAAPEPAASPARPASGVIDRLDLGTTSITGNQELPKVLYIVPWKRSDLGDLAGRPLNTLLDEVLAPIDPEVFERQLSYYETLRGEQAEE